MLSRSPLFVIALTIAVGIGAPASRAVGQPPASPAQMRSATPPGNNPSIRVLISDSVTSVCVTPRAAWSVQSLAGQTLRTLVADRPTTVMLAGGSFRAVTGPLATARDTDTSDTALGSDAIAFVSAKPGATLSMVGWSNSSRERRTYAGRIEIHPSADGTFQCVEILPVEEYLRGVVPHEIGSTSPREALRAQAVAARSEAVRALTSKVYGGTHHDICSTVQCQAYSGLTRNSGATDAAVAATRGWILTYEGQPLPAYYSSNCGGHAEDIRNVWPDRASERGYWGAAPFDGPGECGFDLATEDGFRRWIEEDPACFCNPKHHKMPDWAGKGFRWTREISAADLSKWVAEKKDIGRVRDIRPVRRGCSGRIAEVEFLGEKGTVTVGPELVIRRLFRPALRSSAFTVGPRGGSAGYPEVFVLRGAGNGHGVGMCQTGAIGMANAGKTFQQILKHYYPKAKIEKAY